MPLVKQVKEYGDQSFQAGSRTEQGSTKGIVQAPNPHKGLGVFIYRGFSAIIQPCGDRFSVSILNCGNPVRVQWRYYGDGKLRDSWSSPSMARLITKIFIRYHLNKNHTRKDACGNTILVVREIFAPPGEMESRAVRSLSTVQKQGFDRRKVNASGRIAQAGKK